MVSWIDAYIHPNRFCQVPDQFDAFFNQKNASENNAKISLRHLLVNFKNVRVFAPPMLFSIELWRQWQPLIFPPIHTANGALRSVKHEHRNVVVRDRGCRTAKFQEYLYGMQTQDVLVSTGSTKKIGFNVSFNLRYCAYHKQVLDSGGMLFSVRRVSQATAILEIVSLLRKRHFFGKYEKNTPINRIIIRPAWPL